MLNHNALQQHQHQRASVHLIPTTPKRPLDLNDLFALSLSPNHVIQLENVINDVMSTASNLSTSVSNNNNKRVLHTTCNIHLCYHDNNPDHFSDESTQQPLKKSATASTTKTSLSSYNFNHKIYIDSINNNAIKSSSSNRSTRADYINPLSVFSMKSKKNKKRRKK